MDTAMIPAEVLSAFFLASVLLALAPGPDNIFVLTQSALYGRDLGLAVVGGLCTGLVVHTLGVALGVAVIFQASAAAFTALKLAGAGYLLWLAWQAFRAPAAHLDGTGNGPSGRLRLYRRGIIMNLTNPKVSLFFLAFLPQFADPARGRLPLQMILLGMTFIAATILVFGGIALLAGTLGAWLQRSTSVQRALNWLAGTVFVGLALTLVLARR
jgi:threonine/homoserine/homoserine lactone efflux protein